MMSLVCDLLFAGGFGFLLGVAIGLTLYEAPAPARNPFGPVVGGDRARQDGNLPPAYLPGRNSAV